MTFPSLHSQRFPGLSRSGVRVVVFSLAIVALSLDLTEASASGPSSQNKRLEKPYAVIVGTVWGPDDQPVYGVKVKIRRENEKKTRWEVYSDHHGEFAQRVPAGKADYVVWADVRNHKSSSSNRSQSGDEVAVHVEYDERVDTGLHLK